MSDTSAQVDINADVGESFGAFTIGHDAALIPSITSANVAAGFHGGDPSVLRQTVRIAKQHGVAVGAHPSFPDLVGFGRRELRVSAREAEDFVLYQIAAVAGVAAAEGMALQHVKPHGALYNMAARDRDLAAAIAQATAAFDRRLILFAPFDSELYNAGLAAGLGVAAEAFADRAYEPDGTLVARHKDGAVVNEAGIVLARALRMVQAREVEAVDGSIVPLDVDTICVHGDTPGAASLAAALRRGLESAGVIVRAFRRM